MEETRAIMKLSVIVPLYQGQEYIKNIITTLEMCTEKLNEDTVVELVLSNDFPEDKIFGVYFSDVIDIVVKLQHCNTSSPFFIAQSISDLTRI